VEKSGDGVVSESGENPPVFPSVLPFPQASSVVERGSVVFRTRLARRSIHPRGAHLVEAAGERGGAFAGVATLS
jgi:hypothetical protein